MITGIAENDHILLGNWECSRVEKYYVNLEVIVPSKSVSLCYDH